MPFPEPAPPAIIAAVPRKRPTWFTNWRERHQSRLSFGLHLVGIPLAVGGLLLAAVQLWQWRWDLWWRPVLLLGAGYVLQLIGHWHEGNDLGEWILIKRLLGRPYVAISPKYLRPGSSNPPASPAFQNGESEGGGTPHQAPTGGARPSTRPPDAFPPSGR